jgi:broad specificity phosphatase PhoE
LWDLKDIPGGETMDMVRARARRALDAIVKMEYKSFGLATHGGFIVQLLGLLGIEDVPPVPHAVPTHIRFANNAFKVVSLFGVSG